MAQKSIYKDKVSQQQVDFTNHLSIPAIINSVLSVAGKDAENKGFGVEYLNKQNYSWVLSRFAIEIYKAPAMGESFNTTTWIKDASRVISTRNFVVKEENSENVLAIATSQWCIIDLTARTAVDFAKLGVDYNSFIYDESTINRVKKLKSVTPQATTTHKAGYSHLDFNKHVNTIRYIDMMLDMLPLEVIERSKTLRVDLHFISECRYGDTLTVALEQVENNSLFEITKADGSSAVRGCFEWGE